MLHLFIKVSLLCFALLVIDYDLGAQELSISPKLFHANYYQDDQEVGRKEFVNLLFEAEESKELWKRSQSHKLFSSVMIAAISYSLSSLTWDDHDTPTPYYAILGGGVPLLIWSEIKANRARDKAITIYNSKITKEDVRIGPAISGTGVSVFF